MPQTRECSGPECDETFVAYTPTSQYCSNRCKQRACRVRRLQRRASMPCAVDDCPNVGVFASGLCRMHYARRYNGVPIDEPKRGTDQPVDCSYADCENAAYKRALCTRHYRMFHAEAGKEWAAAQLEWHSESKARFYGGDVSPVDRLAVFDRDGWVCQLCGEPVDPDLKGPDPQCASLDHIVPLSLGGDHSMENTQLAHLGCNASKGNRAM